MSRGRGKKINPKARQARYTSLVESRIHGLQMIEQLATEFPFSDVKSQVLANDEGRVVSLDYEKKWLETLPKDWNFGNKKYQLVVPANNRAWLDLAVKDRQGNIWPVNIKVGSRGETSDNVGGKKILEYLLLAENINPKSLAVEHSYGRLRNETQFAQKIAELMAMPALRPTSIREYFLLHHAHKKDKTRVLPLSAIDKTQIKANPKNGLQLIMARATFDLGRDMDESWKCMADSYYQYLTSMAAPAKAFDKTIKQSRN